VSRGCDADSTRTGTTEPTTGCGGTGYRGRAAAPGLLVRLVEPLATVVCENPTTSAISRVLAPRAWISLITRRSSRRRVFGRRATAPTPTLRPMRKPTVAFAVGAMLFPHAEAGAVALAEPKHSDHPGGEHAQPADIEPAIDLIPSGTVTSRRIERAAPSRRTGQPTGARSSSGDGERPFSRESLRPG
jgi:hypothetical protein